MKKSLLTAVLLMSCYCFSPSANAQPGVLDQTFGVGGISHFLCTDSGTIQSTTDSHTSAIVQQADGKLIVAVTSLPQFSLYTYENLWGSIKRFNADGTKDFNSYGYYPDREMVDKMTLQPDQKLLLLTYNVVRDPNNQGDLFNGIYLNRYNTDGSLDLTFNGRLYNFQYNNNYYYTETGQTNIIVKPNGNILLGFVYPTQNTSLTNYSFDLYQFLPDGTLDSTFGNHNGYETITNLFYYSDEYKRNGRLTANEIKIANDGKIFIGTAMYESLTNTHKVGSIRLKVNGTIDSSYGTNGFAIANFGSSNFYFGAMTLSSDSNNCIIAGHLGFASSNAKLGLVCFDSTGSLNNNFGTGGKVFPVLQDPSNIPISMSVQKDGKIVVAGDNELAQVLSGFPTLLVLRFNSDGTTDSVFGKRGVFSGGESLRDFFTTEIKIQQDGKIIVLGGNLYGSGDAYILRFDSVSRVFYNTLIASSFLDKNGNGIKDVNESFFPLGDIVAAKAGKDTIRSIFNVDKILLDIDTGTYVSRIIPYRPYYNITPTTHITSNTTYFHTDSVTFALKPIPGKRDAAIEIIGLDAARPGLANHYKINYQNTGTDTITTGTVQLIKSNKFNFNSATPSPTFIGGDTLRWDISNLKPLETGGILLNFTVKTPPLVNIGDTLQSTATITSNKPDLTPADNISTVKQVVRGSYDPNDKTENHGGKITTVQVASGEYLQYTIRFQNTGNDTAFNVYIRDTLDNKLDWNTMQILTASHSYQMTMNDGNKCLFTLRNINLVDSTTNEPGSHGYIVYKVKPKPTVALGDTIKNTAAIYFDYNLPVLTNTETTLVINEVLPLRLLSFTARNENKTNLLNWTTTNEINVDHFDIERSPNGREFSKIGSVKAGQNNYHYADNSPLTTANYYRLKILDKDGKFEYSPVRQLIIHHSSFIITIFPNPAKEKLQLEINTDKKTALKMDIIAQDGKVVLSSNIAAAEGSILRSINISALQSGTYFLRVTSSENEQSVVKFEKVL